jgi:hypothetical protein
MLRAMLNRATMRVADTTEVSGRVTADFILYPTLDANTVAILETDPGTIASGVETRGR